MNGFRKFPFAPIILLFKMIGQNGGVSLTRSHVLLLYVIRFLILEPFRLLELILFYNKIHSHRLTQPPIFILGHWRSGTSFLQSMICTSPQVTSNNIYRSIFPDTFYLTESWLKPILNSIIKLFRVPYSLQRIPMDLNLSAEVDMALCSLGSEQSYTWGQLFPKTFESWVDKQILFSGSSDPDRWIIDYDFFIKKLSYQSKGKRVVVKSPGDTGRVQHLIQKYPEACFVYIHRDPVSIFHSNIYFWNVILKQNSLQTILNSELETLIINAYKKVMTSYLNNRTFIPAQQLLEIVLDNVIKQPKQELARIFKFLGLGPGSEKKIVDIINIYHIKERSAYVTDPKLLERLKREWAFAFETWPTSKHQEPGRN